MGFDLPIDEIQKKLQENIDLEADESTRTIQIIFKGDIYQDIPLKDMLEDEQGLGRMSQIFLDEKIEYKTEMLPDGNGVRLIFDSDESFQKMQEFIDGLLYGELLKEVVEKMMKSLFSAFGTDNRSEFNNYT